MWISKHKIIVITVTICLIFLPMMLIHFIFKFHPNNDLLVAEWLPDNALLYWGSCLSFIGTVLLGCVSIYQNKEAQKTNENMLKMQAESEIPLVSFKRDEKSILDVWLFSNDTIRFNVTNLRFNVTNRTQNNAKILLESLDFYDINVKTSVNLSEGNTYNPTRIIFSEEDMHFSV